MNKKSKFTYVLIVFVIAIQFVRPAPNNGNALGANSITTSPDVEKIIQTACYDCHSNHTEYPWYCNIQPVGWWVAHHVNEGKEELNFSEFKNYSLKRKLKKLKEIKEQLEEDEMPLSSYTLIHSDAKISADDKALLLNWLNEPKLLLVDSIPSAN